MADDHRAKGVPIPRTRVGCFGVFLLALGYAGAITSAAVDPLGTGIRWALFIVICLVLVFISRKWGGPAVVLAAVLLVLVGAIGTALAIALR